MDELANIHPGEVLQEEFLLPLGITAYRLAKAIGVQQTRIEQILDGKRAITVDTAIRLGRYFHTTPQFWLNLQMAYELEEEQKGKHQSEYARIHAFDETPTAMA